MADSPLYTPEKAERICDALHEKPSVAAACRRVRISRKTYYNWRKSQDGFAAMVDAAKNEGLDAAEDALIERGMKSDTTALIFMLKAHRPDVYKERFSGELTGKDGGPIAVTQIRDHVPTGGA